MKKKDLNVEKMSKRGWNKDECVFVEEEKDLNVEKDRELRWIRILWSKHLFLHLQLWYTNKFE